MKMFPKCIEETKESFKFKLNWKRKNAFQFVQMFDFYENNNECIGITILTATLW